MTMVAVAAGVFVIPAVISGAAVLSIVIGVDVGGTLVAVDACRPGMQPTRRVIMKIKKKRMVIVFISFGTGRKGRPQYCS